LRSQSEQELRVEILRYLLEHPDALDHAEGILAWWFSEERMRLGLAAVRRVLGGLVEEGYVVAGRVGGARTVYSLNKQRKEDIVRVIENSGS
jgi:Fe2+ or Zn2+ uptake regulation protein